MKTKDRDFVAAVLSMYTMLICISFLLYLVSPEISILFTAIWVMLTLIPICGVVFACIMNILILFYKKLLKED